MKNVIRLGWLQAVGGLLVLLVAGATPALAGDETIGTLPYTAVRLYLPDADGKMVEVVSPFAKRTPEHASAIRTNALRLALEFEKAGDRVEVTDLRNGNVAVELSDRAGVLARLEFDPEEAQTVQANPEAGISIDVWSQDGAWSVSICLKGANGCTICFQLNKHAGHPIEFHIFTNCNGVQHHFHCQNIFDPLNCRWLW